MPLSKIAEAYRRGDEKGFNAMIAMLGKLSPPSEVKECKRGDDCECHEDAAEARAEFPDYP